MVFQLSAHAVRRAELRGRAHPGLGEVPVRAAADARVQRGHSRVEGAVLAVRQRVNQPRDVPAGGPPEVAAVEGERHRGDAPPAGVVVVQRLDAARAQVVAVQEGPEIIIELAGMEAALVVEVEHLAGGAVPAEVPQQAQCLGLAALPPEVPRML